MTSEPTMGDIASGPHRKSTNRLQRRIGIALWRQIADEIRSGIATGLGGSDGRLPPEKRLAERFGVNRHTVRAAIASLVQDGVLRTEQGRGTFILKRPRLRYAIGRRTRFSAGLQSQTRSRTSALLSHAGGPATARVAAALEIPEGAAVIQLDTLGTADGVPITRSISWFDAARFAPIAAIYDRTRSFTAAFAELGIHDYIRKSTTIEARHADAEDVDVLGLSPGAIVLGTHAVNVDPGRRPIQFSETRFAADRVSLQVDDDVDTAH